MSLITKPKKLRERRELLFFLSVLRDDVDNAGECYAEKILGLLDYGGGFNLAGIARFVDYALDWWVVVVSA